MTPPATVPPEDDTAPGQPDAAAPPLVPGYEVVEALGRGGMGVVYMARHVPLNRTVALKMIRGAAGGDDLRRFQNEAEASARLHHPNIVQVYEVGSADGRPYLSLEYVAGGSLDRAIGDTPQPPPLSAATVEKLARAVQVAHAAGILHRDLKPANVLLAPSADGVLPWVPKVADFGLAKRFQEDVGQTQTGAILGTPSYMAPEQASGGGKDVGPAADVYALGAILYHMLTGRPPFKAASSWDTIAQVLHDDPVPPSAFHPKLPRDLETVCLKCLHKSPDRRYATAEDLADDLGRFLRGEPVAARPVGSWERAVKWVRRRPAAAGLVLAGVVTALALVGGVVAVYFNGQLQKSADLAENRRQEAEDQREYAEGRKRAAEWSATEADKQRAAATVARDNEAKEKLAANVARDNEAKEKLAANVARDNEAKEKLAANVARDNEAKQRELATTARDNEAKQRELAERFQYIAQVGLAQRAFEERQFPRVFALLDRHRPAPGAPDARQFEWHHLRRATRNLLCLHAHREDAHDVAYSPDGKWLATAGWDNVAGVWDAVTGAKVKAFAFKQTGAWQRVMAVAFNHDATRLAVAFHHGVTVFDIATGREVFQLKGHTNTVASVALSPDGVKYATGSADGSVRVWDATDGKPRVTFPARPGELIRRVTFSPDSAFVACAVLIQNDEKVGGGMVRVWSVYDQKEIVTKLTGVGTSDIAFDPTGTRLAIPRGNSVRVISVKDGQELWSAEGHTNRVSAVAFSRDGKRVASAGYDLTVRVWDAADGKPVLTLEGHAGRETMIRNRGASGVNRVAFSPDGSRLVSACDGGEVMVWDMTAPPAAPAPPPKTPNVFVSPGRTREAAWVPARGVVEVRSHPDGKVLHELKGGKARRVRFERDDRVVVEYGGDARESVRVWDASSGKSLVTVSPPADARIFLSGDGNTLAVATRGLKLVDVATGKETASRGLSSSPIGLVVFSPDGKRVATAPAARPATEDIVWADCSVTVWDVATGNVVVNLREHTSAVRSIAWSADGGYLVTASQDNRAIAWALPDGRVVQRFVGLRTPLNAVAFSPNNRRVATGGEDRVVRLWDVYTGEEVLALKGHTQAVAEVKFTADGTALLSRAGTDEWKLWDARPTDR